MATRKQTYTHTHATRNAITLVWGSLRLAPITPAPCASHFPFYLFLAGFYILHLFIIAHALIWGSYYGCRTFKTFFIKRHCKRVISIYQKKGFDELHRELPFSHLSLYHLPPDLVPCMHGFGLHSCVFNVE